VSTSPNNVEELNKHFLSADDVFTVSAVSLETIVYTDLTPNFPKRDTLSEHTHVLKQYWRYTYIPLTLDR
jgi:hypothetical protein